MFSKQSLATAFVLVLVVFTAAEAAQADPILIAHNGVAESSLGAGQVKDVFLGKTAQWGDGSRIVLSMLKDGEVSKTFLKDYAGKSQKQFATFWKKAVFSGTGEMPSTFGTEAELVAFVAATPGAVGYIDAGTPHADVKVIAID